MQQNLAGGCPPPCSRLQDSRDRPAARRACAVQEERVADGARARQLLRARARAANAVHEVDAYNGSSTWGAGPAKPG